MRVWATRRSICAVVLRGREREVLAGDWLDRTAADVAARPTTVAVGRDPTAVVAAVANRGPTWAAVVAEVLRAAGTEAAA